jgi:hypothetical protein
LQEFEADKATGKFAANMHRVPILTVDGMDIAQVCNSTAQLKSPP